jgi:toxin-antitoxin system PIN domain toxin
MRRLLDINTWIALTVETHPQHRAARKWYEQTALTPGDLVFCRPTEIGFLRLLTQAAVMARCSAKPLTNSEAAEFLLRLHADPAVSSSGEPPTARLLWLELANLPHPAPNLWIDA